MDTQILKQLKAYHQGAGKSIHSAELERQYDIGGSTIRDLIRLLRRRGEPIGNCSLGYYYCQTRAELEGLIGNLHNRAMSMLTTVSKLEKNREKNGFSQLEMFR